nr:putative ABC transporter permease [Bacilli bacterium]
AGYYAISMYINKLNIFLKYLLYASVGTMVELICGLVLEYGLNMYAWSYKNSFMNFKGHICLFMFLVWGIFGVLFEYTTPYLRKFLNLTRNKVFNIILPFFTAFMIFNFTVTGIAIVRWADRHKGIEATNKITKHIDKKYNDKYMEKRFMEWHFFE